MKSLIASVALLALSPLAAAAQDRTLTISVYAFAQDDFKTIVYDPFEKQCGCNGLYGCCFLWRAFQKTETCGYYRHERKDYLCDYIT